MSLVITRGQPQGLDDAAGGRCVAVRGVVGNQYPHEGLSALLSGELTIRRSNQILLLDGGAKAIVFGNKALDEFMQAALENVLNTQVFQLCAHAPGLLLR